MLKTFIKLSFGLFFGAIIAAAYLVLKIAGTKGGMDMACITSLILFVLHLLIWPKLTLNSFKEKQNWLRGFLFGITQVFLLNSQRYGSTSAMLVAGIAGALVGSFLGRLMLKEKPTWLDIAAILIGVVGIIIGNENIQANTWAIAGGVIQGITSVVARSMMNKKLSRRGAVSSGFFILSIVSAIALIIDHDIKSVTVLPLNSIIMVTIVSALAQYAFFQLYKFYDTQKAAVISLLRVPWAVVLELIVLGTVISSAKLISSTIIIIAAAASLIHHARKQILQRS